MVLIQRRINVDATSWRCIDVNATLSQCCIPAGTVSDSLVMTCWERITAITSYFISVHTKDSYILHIGSIVSHFVHLFLDTPSGLRSRTLDTLDHEVHQVRILIEADFGSWLYGAPLHRAFHCHFPLSIHAEICLSKLCRPRAKKWEVSPVLQRLPFYHILRYYYENTPIQI